MFPWKIEPLIEDEKIIEEEEEEENNNEEIEYETFWSSAHRARITRPKNIKTNKIYKKILGEINEIEENKKEKKDIIKYQNIPIDDPFYLLMNRENRLDELEWKLNYNENKVLYLISR